MNKWCIALHKKVKIMYISEKNTENEEPNGEPISTNYQHNLQRKTNLIKGDAILDSYQNSHNFFCLKSKLIPYHTIPTHNLGGIAYCKDKRSTTFWI